MKFRKKPVEIEAFQYDGYLTTSEGVYYVPQWAIEAFQKDIIHYGENDSEIPYELYIETLEGTHHASIGDYIIKGIKGELYPCKPDIFEQTYDSVEQNEQTIGKS